MLAKILQAGLTLGLAAAAVAAGPPADKKAEGTKVALTDKPLTVKVDLAAELQADVAAAAKPDAKATVRLTLAGVVPPENRDQVEGVRVFLNKSDAGRETPTDDPHYVSTFAFSPTTQRDAQEFNLDLTRTVAELQRQGKCDLSKPLRFTLVAVPAGGVKDLPAGFSVPIEKASVAVDRSK